MHESGITRSAVEALLDAGEQSRTTRPESEVDELSGVVPDSVRFCFGLVVEGAALDGAPSTSPSRPGGVGSADPSSSWRT
ncbi:Zn finger protein HypA/HybF involved in hydrogenase expression [Saccharopolyspora lacisalsi]|uniref:Zn finger protein HypA/HybF involved in hydrogenase expression n=1 Tax=Halosaccharopolyspora lacisalsi TaxID=1000566 RepID=A0A839DRJ1_9PSEU|nr:hydrogenase maturation nickel metallochaperone HypA [Halosaccharopolyspora lacisalsi]MBA8823580.1 Zn finger protein HypA/HybF involved in hydrogenase expression [Halosaccharopolyspora lacisalsi]